MAKSRNRKNHKQKVDARNQKIKNERRRGEKYYTEELMKMIESEKTKGLFDDSKEANIEG